MIFDEIVIFSWEKPDGSMPNLRERLAMRKHCGPYRFTPRDPAKSSTIGFYQSSHGELRMGDGVCRLRLEWANGHLSGRKSQVTGYFCDADGYGDTLKPIIARLNHERGYLAGWTMGCGMCAALDLSVYDSPESAAWAAHSMAEHDAEEEVQRDLERIEQERADELCEREEDAHEALLG